MNFFRRFFRPTLTGDMQRMGLVWAWIEGRWREVCDVCGGNCGQCGLTARLGNVPLSLERVVKSGGWDKHPPYGLPGKRGHSMD